MIPYARHDGTPMTPEQCAEWLGCDVATMQREHDGWHHWLARKLWQPSWSMREAKGETLPSEEKLLADLEEHAVLAISRFFYHATAFRTRS